MGVVAVVVRIVLLQILNDLWIFFGEERAAERGEKWKREIEKRLSETKQKQLKGRK